MDDMDLAHYVDTLSLLGDESRLRLCALLHDRELCVADLVRVTGISQPRVSTHLGRLREAGVVRDRRKGPQSFYTLDAERLPTSAKTLLTEAARSADPTLDGDRARLRELEVERRNGLAEYAPDELERFYAPGRSWQSLAVGIAALLRLDDVLDVGSGDGAPASAIAPYCRSLCCVDANARMVDQTRERLAPFPHASARLADVHDLPFATASFDTILLFHTLTYAARPARAVAECARVLRPNGRLVVLCLDRHRRQDVTAKYGERHPGFSPRSVRRLLGAAGLDVVAADVACRESRKPHLQVVLAIAEKGKSSPPAKKVGSI
jgi:SAM-dependent methyltransferase/biotin operon repressor